MTHSEMRDNQELNKLIDLIFSKNPLQKKRITKYFSEKADATFWDFCEDLSKTLNNGLLATDVDKQKAADAYIKMCKDFLSEQIKFKREGKYSCLDASVANTEVYGAPEVMRYYMVGLLISYMFWPNHYELFKFFEKYLPEKNVKNYLEVGVGHGLFTSTILKKYPHIKPTLVDISETSINTAKEVLTSFNINIDNINFVHQDYLEAKFEEKFDFIIMGEVLEHVNDPARFMKKTKELLNPNGTIYLSTCANSPALDHVYRFYNAKDMRDMMIDNGFRIIDDLVLASENVPEEDWEKELVTINYCALLEHDNKLH